MYHADNKIDTAPTVTGRGTFGLLTLNLGLLGFELTSDWRVPIDSRLKQRLAAAPDLLAALGADVIALQEVYTEADRQFLIEALESRYPFNSGGPKTFSPVGSGLLLLSRVPVLQSEFIPCRGAPWWTHPFWKQGFLKVEINLPLIGQVCLVNVHLAASVPFCLSTSRASRANREREIAQLLTAAGTGNFPTILIGDFNTSPEIYPEGYRKILDAGYVDAYTASRSSDEASPGFTWDAANPLNQRGRFRNFPSQRIDHVFISRKRSSNLFPVSARIVLQEKTMRTSFGQPIPLSDHYGMLVTLAALPAVSSQTSGGGAEAADRA